jgi:putative methionine-R-sulfoxide reductase with GAF domain
MTESPLGHIQSALRRVLMGSEARTHKAALAAELIRNAGQFRWVGVYDVLEDEIAVIAWAGPHQPSHPRFLRSQGLNGVAVREGKPVVVQDVSTDARYLTTMVDTKAEAIFPVFADDGTVAGTLDVESADLNAFPPVREAWLVKCAATLTPLWRDFHES